MRFESFALLRRGASLTRDTGSGVAIGCPHNVTQSPPKTRPPPSTWSLGPLAEALWPGVFWGVPFAFRYLSLRESFAVRSPRLRRACSSSVHLSVGGNWCCPSRRTDGRTDGRKDVARKVNPPPTVPYWVRIFPRFN